jgi:hypothetical protein
MKVSFLKYYDFQAAIFEIYYQKKATLNYSM